MHRSLLTRMLHATIAVAIITQLIGIGLAVTPMPGVPGNLAFSVRQAVGLGALGLPTAFCLGALLRRNAALGVHQASATLMWTNLVGHLALPIVHESLGHRSLRSTSLGLR